MRRPMVARGEARLCERNPWYETFNLSVLEPRSGDRRAIVFLCRRSAAHEFKLGRVFQGFRSQSLAPPLATIGRRIRGYRAEYVVPALRAEKQPIESQGLPRV